MVWRTVLLASASMSLLFAARANGGTNRDAIFESRLAECMTRQDGRCLLQLAAFDEAATAFEASPESLPDAVVLRRQLRQVDRAYADALAFVRWSRNPMAMQAVADEAFGLLESLEEAGDDAKTIDFLRRYLHDFKAHASHDHALVAHAKLGALRMKQSCSIATFHGACVEFVRELRPCPEVNEGPFTPQLISNLHTPPRTSYSVDLAKTHPRNARLVREAREDMQAVLDSSSYFLAEQQAFSSPSRLRALANAKAQAILALATPELDAFLALGGVPEDLSFDQATLHDTRREARRKTEE